MKPVTITLQPEEVLRLEAILMDRDEKMAFNFLKTVLKPKVQAQGNRTLDSQKGTGVPL